MQGGLESLAIFTSENTNPESVFVPPVKISEGVLMGGSLFIFKCTTNKLKLKKLLN